MVDAKDKEWARLNPFCLNRLSHSSRWTMGQVRVRTTPLMSWSRDTTCRPEQVNAIGMYQGDQVIRADDDVGGADATG